MFKRLIFMDCQTTGMRPPRAQLVELGWALAEGESLIREQEYLVKLRDGQPLPPMVREITGLDISDLENGIELDDLARALQQVWLDFKPDACLIHYAQFERPFLTDLFERVSFSLPNPIYCTHQLCKRLFPNLPSQNIRAAAGYFGPAILGLNRAGIHVRATRQIWQGLTTELNRRGLTSVAAIDGLLKEKPGKTDGGAKAKPSYEYRFDRLKRLRLPECPGVYRMLDKDGRILYVGKATSLRDRVNSYFRGRKGREKRKLEMMAQVWDIAVTPLRTPLEAALFESDEIKRHDPPYNVALKVGRRRLYFYDREFNQREERQTAVFRHGPFMAQTWIEHLRLVTESVNAPEGGEFKQIFFRPIPPDNLRAGFYLHCLLDGLDLKSPATIRALLAHGHRLLRIEAREARLAAATTAAVETATAPAGADTEDRARGIGEHESDGEGLVDNGNDGNDDGSVTEDIPLTPDEIAAKFHRLFVRAAREYQRAKRLTRLLNSQVQLSPECNLTFRDGRLTSHRGEDHAETALSSLHAPESLSHCRTANGSSQSEPPWSGLGVDTYDRMAIVLSQIHHEARIYRRW